VAAYIEQMPGSKPTIKKKLAAIRMLYDFLVIRQLVPGNPTASVRWPKYVVKRGKTPVWSREVAKKLLESIRREGDLAGLRDRAHSQTSAERGVSDAGRVSHLARDRCDDLPGERRPARAYPADGRA
jgi:site-specific recombinase XerC